MANDLNRLFNEGRIHVKTIMPKHFLANLTKLFSDNYKELQNELKKINHDRSQEKQKYVEQLKNNHEEIKGLVLLLAEAINKDKVGRVEVLNLPKQKEIKIPEYPKEINFVKPKWWQPFSPKVIIDNLKQGTSETIVGFGSLLDRHKKKENAFAVRLVDKEGNNFYTAIAQAISGITRTVGITNWPADYPDAATIAHLATIVARTPTLGQKTKAGSVPVTLSSDEDNVNVDVISSALPTGAATSAKQLADNHQVTVSNPTTNPETGLAKDATLGEVQANPTTNTVLDRLKTIDTNQQTDALTDTQLRASAVPVDGSGVTQPVSGTFWQGTQPVSGTFWQATQPVSAASLPLPSGAATSAKQLADGHNVTLINSQAYSTTSGTISAIAASTTIITATADQIGYLYGYSIIHDDITAILVRLEDGNGGTELARWYFDNIAAGAVTGANMCVNPPAYLVKTTANTILSMETSSAGTIHYTFYWWKA